MKDPVNDIFYLDTWLALAEKNTKIYRSVFRCMPDSEVKSWKEYKEYAAYGERFAEMQSRNSSKAFKHSQSRQTGPPGTGTGFTTVAAGATRPHSLHPGRKSTKKAADEKASQFQASAPNYNTDSQPQPERDNQEALSPIDEKSALGQSDTPVPNNPSNDRSDDGGGATGEDVEKPRPGSQLVDYSDALNRNARPQTLRRKRRTTVGSRRELQATDEVMDTQRAEELLTKVQGNLILWPYDWLEKEEQGGNWLYTLDQISPLEIYN
ncbi:Phospholipase D1 [Aspergillus sp. HF37]|nr:Phospholipase D1 [Aspergillus sp. HF37]